MASRKHVWCDNVKFADLLQNNICYLLLQQTDSMITPSNYFEVQDEFISIIH